MLSWRREGRLRWNMRSKSLFIERRSVSKVYACVLARSLERCASVCIAGVGFERMEPTLPACWFEVPEHAVRERNPAVRMIEEIALVRVFMMGCPCVAMRRGLIAYLVTGSR